MQRPIIAAWHAAARSLGHERGSTERAAAIAEAPLDEPFDYAVAPLSGEWAGQSIPEVFRDITGQDYGAVDYVDHWVAQDVLDAYEDAYCAAFYGE